MIQVPRVAAAASVLLFGLVAIVATQALLFALLAMFSSILGLRLDIQLGPQSFALEPSRCCGPGVVIFNAGTVGSFLFTLGCGFGAALSRFRSWRPPA